METSKVADHDQLKLMKIVSSSLKKSLRILHTRRECSSSGELIVSMVKQPNARKERKIGGLREWFEHFIANRTGSRQRSMHFSLVWCESQQRGGGKLGRITGVMGKAPGKYVPSVTACNCDHVYAVRKLQAACDGSMRVM